MKNPTLCVGILFCSGLICLLFFFFFLSAVFYEFAKALFALAAALQLFGAVAALSAKAGILFFELVEFAENIFGYFRVGKTNAFSRFTGATALAVAARFATFLLDKIDFPCFVLLDLFVVFSLRLPRS